jgi:glycosyltransferase involved in cell wall biosynthesis
VTPTVSVCVPVYNGAAFIGETIRSVLAQTYTDFELIVMENVSTDGTADVVRAIDDPRLKLICPDEHVPAPENFARATAACSGRYVKMVCADDTLKPECLERQVAALEAQPRAVMVASQRDIIDAEGEPLVTARGLAGMRGYVPGPEAVARCIRTGSNPLGESASVLIRGDALRRVGPWRDTFGYMIDLDMWFRLLEHGGLVALPESLATFRVHAASWSNKLARQQAGDTRRLHRYWAEQIGPEIGRDDVRIGAVQTEVVAFGRRIVSSPAFRRVRPLVAR